MKISKQNKRTILASAIVAATTFSSVGCSNGMSLSSMNPFNKTAATVAPQPSEPSAVASAATSAKNQLASFGTSTKAAVSKTTSSVTNLFAKKDADSAAAEDAKKTDPTSLSNMPGAVSPEIFVKNGQLWESTGNIEKAMANYSQALAAAPNDTAALRSIARLHASQNRFAQAIGYFEKAIASKPDDAELYSNYGLALQKVGQHQKSEAALVRALELAPGSSRFANRLATIRFDAGNKTGAFETLKSNNKPAIAHFNMAYLHYKSGQLIEAQQHLSETLKYEPLAADDPSVKRAVERSREMLAQLDGPASAIAQAGAAAAQTAAGQPVAAAQPAAKIAAVTEVAKPAVSMASSTGTPTYTLGTKGPVVTSPSSAATGSKVRVPSIPASSIYNISQTSKTQTPAAQAPTYQLPAPQTPSAPQATTGFTLPANFGTTPAQ